MQIVRGKIYIKDDPGANRVGTAYIRLLDTSRADASSIKVAETIYTEVNLQDIFIKGKEFKLQLDEINQNLRYEVAVLLDFDGDGKKRKGDYISKQSHPVLTKGYPDYVKVLVSVI